MNTQAIPYKPVVGPQLLEQKARLIAILRRWHERARQRRQLAQLDDDRLRDIGISREQALAEARKPFWR